MGTKKKRPQAKSRLNFDGIANKFDQNIYGTSKGQLRHRLLVDYLSEYIENETPMKVLDAGGGTGMMSFEFLKNQHKVTLIDTSKDVLAIAEQRLEAFSNYQVDCKNITEIEEKYDLVLCHAVLEWLPKPLEVLRHISERLLSKDGILSLSFFNYDAMLLNNVLYGNFDYVKAGMKARNTVRLNPHNPQKPNEIISFLEKELGFKTEHHAGIRCFHDYMLDKTKIDNEFEALYEMEKTFGRQAPYKWIGKYCHLILKKRKLTSCC